MSSWVRKALGQLVMVLAIIGFIAASGMSDSGGPSLLSALIGGIGAGAMFAALRFGLLDDDASSVMARTSLPAIDLFGEEIDLDDSEWEKGYPEARVSKKALGAAR